VPQSPCVSMHLAPSTHDRHLLQSASAAAAASASSAVALACPTCTALACSSASRAFATSAASGLSETRPTACSSTASTCPCLSPSTAGSLRPQPVGSSPCPVAAATAPSQPPSACRPSQRLPSHIHLKSHDGRYLGKGDRCLMSLATDRWQTRGS
jgi:hypothetical protein